ncbi:MAG: hypothetical protein ACI8ZN_002615 [Bacteroidia bacterium]|jgi:hypothetical protein
MIQPSVTFLESDLFFQELFYLPLINQIMKYATLYLTMLLIVVSSQSNSNTLFESDGILEGC